MAPQAPVKGADSGVNAGLLGVGPGINAGATPDVGLPRARSGRNAETPRTRPAQPRNQTQNRRQLTTSQKFEMLQRILGIKEIPSFEITHRLAFEYFKDSFDLQVQNASPQQVHRVTEDFFVRTFERLKEIMQDPSNKVDLSFAALAAKNNKMPLNGEKLISSRQIGNMSFEQFLRYLRSILVEFPTSPIKKTHTHAMTFYGDQILPESAAIPPLYSQQASSDTLEFAQSSQGSYPKNGQRKYVLPSNTAEPSLTSSVSNRLMALTSFMKQAGLGAFSSLNHILPFFPEGGDGGFSVIDFHKIKHQIAGTWREVSNALKKLPLGKVWVDFVLNHIDVDHADYKRFLKGDLRAGKKFLAFDFVENEEDLRKLKTLDRAPTHATFSGSPMAFLNGHELNLKWRNGFEGKEYYFDNIFHPRPTQYLKLQGINHQGKSLKFLVWKTFSDKQVDLNHHNPEVMADINATLLLYALMGSDAIRGDAIPYALKQMVELLARQQSPVAANDNVNVHQTNALRGVALMGQFAASLGLDIQIIPEVHFPSSTISHYFQSIWSLLNARTDEEPKLSTNYRPNNNSDKPPLLSNAAMSQAQAASSGGMYNFGAPGSIWMSKVLNDVRPFLRNLAVIKDIKNVEIINFLTTHDGTSLNGLRGLVEKMSAISDALKAWSRKTGLIDENFLEKHMVGKARVGPDQEVYYEIGLAFADLYGVHPKFPLRIKIAELEDALMLLISMNGTPQFYLPQFFGVHTDFESMLKANHRREGNRPVLIGESIQKDVVDPVLMDLIGGALNFADAKQVAQVQKLLVNSSLNELLQQMHSRGLINLYSTNLNGPEFMRAVYLLHLRVLAVRKHMFDSGFVSATQRSMGIESKLIAAQSNEEIGALAMLNESGLLTFHSTNLVGTFTNQTLKLAETRLSRKTTDSDTNQQVRSNTASNLHNRFTIERPMYQRPASASEVDSTVERNTLKMEQELFGELENIIRSKVKLALGSEAENSNAYATQDTAFTSKGISTFSFETVDSPGARNILKVYWNEGKIIRFEFQTMSDSYLLINLRTLAHRSSTHYSIQESGVPLGPTVSPLGN
ncbi:MAG: hypothetical protein COT74_07205 [Bdellovibrionales bacterium CG10_big_fil_rev_8_21_14_0_10_45_34]|nr:MAG: hypothetical protein COT74_07205 [Bdellovibrionales bacterium CG10_big_fil_rev_8_21_14_0_10_45_34]